jgi:hypothetical protein
MKQVNGDGPSNATSQDPPTQEPSSNADASANEHDPAQNSLQLLDLGKELPATMSDDLTVPLGKRLDKCHQEGFMHCVREHILALAKSNVRN